MIHNLNLKEVYFNLVKDKIKTFEVRLFDEKRKLINVGDTIIFTCGDDKNPTLETRVVSLLQFESFEKMASYIPSRLIGFENCTINQIIDTYHKFYTPEQEKFYGVLAIEVQVIEGEKNG